MVDHIYCRTLGLALLALRAPLIVRLLGPPRIGATRRLQRIHLTLGSWSSLLLALLAKMHRLQSLLALLPELHCLLALLALGRRCNAR